MASLPETYVSQEEGGECLEDKEENTASKMDPDSEELKCVQIANEGMKLLLSSRMREAEEMYRRSRFQGPQLNAGYSFVALVKALMSFEDEDLDGAYKLLIATERFTDPTRGFGGKLRSSSSQLHQQSLLSAHEKLYRRSIIADCLLFEAVIVFLKQGFSSYVKGGYILRKAWKMYEKVYAETEQLCTHPSPIIIDTTSPVDKHVGTSFYDKGEEGVEIRDQHRDSEQDNNAIDAFSASMPGLLSGLEEAAVDLEGELGNQKEDEEDEEEVIPQCDDETNGGVDFGKDEVDTDTCMKEKTSSGFSLPDVDSHIRNLESDDDRLRGGVYFGYGLMNVIVSLIPPKLMKLANLFGFHGSRKVGLQALEYACHSQDMKAPIARLSLLWYHTIVRPFFALDGEQEDAGAEEALRLLKEAETQYPDSAFFLYFRGKIHYLRSQLDEALDAYSYAASLSRDQREIEHICLFEKGWIHYLKLQYSDALPCFIRLKNETRWSSCFYAYIAAISAGMQGDLKQARELFLQCGKLVKRKNNNLEKFCSRRSSVYKAGPSPLMQIEMTLMCIEILYLWRALPFCSNETKMQLLNMLDRAHSRDGIPFHHGMRALLRGCILCSLDRFSEAETALHEATKFEKIIRHDKHIMSFAFYELALIHINRDEFARARMYLNHAKDAFSGYEFEARLNFKVHSAMALVR